MTTAVAAYDESFLAHAASLVNPEDTAGLSGPDQLKINYEEDSIHPRGQWVIGQRKDKDGIITEHGQVVRRMIILATRCRYNYYDEKTKQTVSSQIFKSGEQPPDKAECDTRAAALGGQMKFQLVLLGLALVEGGFKEFISYQAGTGYVAFRDYLKELCTVVVGPRRVAVPPFAHITEFGESEKKKNGTVTYWIPQMSKGPALTVEQMEFMASKRNEAYGFVDFINMRAAERAERETETPPAAPMGPAVSMGSMVPPASAADPFAALAARGTGADAPLFFPGPNMPDISGMKSANPASTPVVPASTPTPAPVDPLAAMMPSAPAVAEIPAAAPETLAPTPDDAAYDIEAAMMSIIGGK